MQLPLHVEAGSSQTLQNQVFDQLRGLILDGVLKPGAPVPATRTLAEQLGVSRNTVALAYERLAVEGYLETREAVGTFVSSTLPEDTLGLDSRRSHLPLPASAPPRTESPILRARRHTVVNPHRSRLAVDFFVGRPDARSFPLRIWRRLATQRLGAGSMPLTEYGPPQGLPELRQAIAAHLGPARGIKADADQIIITAGCQEGFNLVSRLLIEKGSLAAVECPGYQGAAYLLESYGAALYPVPVDEYGLDPSLLPSDGARLAYVTPSHQYPLGGTMPLERRLRLMEWAHRTGAYIVEDDYDSDFRYTGSPLTAVKGMDRCGCVFYLGTFSKSIGAGLRLGYLVVPDHMKEAAVTAKALLNNGHPWLDQAVLTDFLTSGAFATHLRRIRHAYRLRRDCLVDALTRHFDRPAISGLDGGMHLAWHLPKNYPTAPEVQELALAKGVGVYSLETGAACALNREPEMGRILLFGYSSTDKRQIIDGVGRLARALSEAGVPVKDV